MSCSSGEEGGDLGLMVKATKAADDLYHLRDSYFPADPEEKISKLQNEVDHALKLLDSIPLDQRKLPAQRATYEFLRGKILDVFPDYRKEAEDHLSKAVKLNPSLADAWLCLGNCIWKKGDLLSAKNCFSLALEKGPNKKILCQLSMLERKLAQGSENQAEIVEQSIRHAKEAIALDIKDGDSWYQLLCKLIIPRQAHESCLYEYRETKRAADHLSKLLLTVEFVEVVESSFAEDLKKILYEDRIDNLGNACLTSFFVTGAWEHNKLVQSLKAYQNAEKDERMKSNPDLYFNSATVNKYLENYDRALSGFEAAALKDPGLNATEEVQKIVYLLDKMETSLKGQVRAKRIASMASSLGEVNLNSSHTIATISLLQEGLNKARAVVGKVVLFLKHDSIAPLYYVVCDSEQTCFILTVYGLRADVIKEGDMLTLVEPYFRAIDFSWKVKRYQFKSIRVDFLEQILVNGKAVAPRQAAHTSIYAQHKP